MQPFSDAQIVIDAAHYPVAFANLHAEANVAPGGTQGRTPLVFSIAPSEPAFDNQFGTLLSQVVIKLPDITVADVGSGDGVASLLLI